MFGYTFLKDGCYQGFFFSPPDGTLSELIRIIYSVLLSRELSENCGRTTIRPSGLVWLQVVYNSLAIPAVVIENLWVAYTDGIQLAVWSKTLSHRFSCACTWYKSLDTSQKSISLKNQQTTNNHLLTDHMQQNARQSLHVLVKASQSVFLHKGTILRFVC